MTRKRNLKADILAAARALAVAAALTACSSTPGDGGGGGGAANGSFAGDDGGTASSGGSSGASSGGAGSSGSGGGLGSGGSGGVGASSGSGGSSGVGGSSGAGASSGAGSSSGTGSSSGASSGGGSSNGIPTAPGITVGPTGATDLAVPPSTDGIQFATPAGMYSVAPGQEIFPNYCVTVPSTIQVGGFQSWMSVGSSHQFILYKGGTAPAGGACTLGANTWIYATSTPGQVVTENMPANVGLQIAQNTQLIINMHFINPGSTSIQPQIKINLLFAKNVMYQAGTMVSFNSTINVPAATTAGPGTQTVSGTCTAPVGAQFFTMSTHTHKHATAAWVDFIHAGTTTEIVHTGTASSYPADQEQGSGLDYEHPGVGLWTAPNFLTVQSGDSFTYHCSYSNTGTTAVTVGETAASNEMCMAVGYYFPAGNALCQ
jgi:hypothetical protein